MKKSASVHAIFSTAVILCAMPLCQACDKLEAQQHAEKGKSELLHCNFENAYYHFNKAHSLYPSHKDILTGLAISELAAFADTNEMRSLFKRLGLNGNLHTWCIAQIDSQSSSTPNSPEISCKTFELRTLMNSNNNQEDPDNTSALDPSLTWNDILLSLAKNQSLLRDAAYHFSSVAQKTSLDSPFTTDFAGYSSIPLHQADSAAISATLFLLSAALDILTQYTWNFSVKESIDAFQTNNDAFWTQNINQNVLMASTSEASCNYLIDDIQEAVFALKPTVSAITSIKQQFESNDWTQLDKNGCEKRHALFHWENLKYGILADFTKASHTMDESETSMVLSEFFDPAVTLDLHYLSCNPPIRTTNHDILDIQNGKWHWTLHDEIHQINQAFTPAILNEDSSKISFVNGIYYRLSSAWLNWSIVTIL